MSYDTTPMGDSRGTAISQIAKTCFRGTARFAQSPGFDIFDVSIPVLPRIFAPILSEIRRKWL